MKNKTAILRNFQCPQILEYNLASKRKYPKFVISKRATYLNEEREKFINIKRSLKGHLGVINNMVVWGFFVCLFVVWLVWFGSLYILTVMLRDCLQVHWDGTNSSGHTIFN